jgi:hydrogenase-4 component E
MVHVLLILFTITLLYLSIASRLLTYLKILAFQGVLLFGLAFIELREVSTLNLVFILLETIIFKALAVPIFINYIIRRNNITRESEPFLPNFVSLIVVTGIILTAIMMSHSVQDELLEKSTFIVALSTVFTGMYIIATRKKVITHVMGYMVLENGVFILSLAVGNEMPMLLNLGIMLDIFASVFILGIFVNKIGDVLKGVDVDQLKNLKD